jgi:hypothetical protein
MLLINATALLGLLGAKIRVYMHQGMQPWHFKG